MDSHLVHMISPNVYRTSSEALETFEWFSKAGEWDENFPRWERNLMVYVGATAMWAIGKRLKKRHGLTDDVRSHLYDACNRWTNEIEKKKTKFLGGNEPNLADLNVFGVLNSMEGCQAFKDCLQNTKIGEFQQLFVEINQVFIRSVFFTRKIPCHFKLRKFCKKNYFFVSFPIIGPWFYAMKEHVQNRRGTVLSQVDMQYLPN